jgi:protein gp37
MPTKISWCDETWNAVTGCSRVSDGCKHCYAEALSLRFGWSKKPWAAANAAENVVLHPERLRKPYSFRQPSRVFVNSMSDLFHPLVPDDFIRQVWDVMLDLPQHTFQILTKRPERMALWPGPWPAHIWAGTSVEDHRVASRIFDLGTCDAAVKFLSCEPLIGPLSVSPLPLASMFRGMDWVIAGRPVHEAPYQVVIELNGEGEYGFHLGGFDTLGEAEAMRAYLADLVTRYQQHAAAGPFDDDDAWEAWDATRVECEQDIEAFAEPMRLSVDSGASMGSNGE